MKFPDDYEFIPLKNSPFKNERKEPAEDGWRTNPPLSRDQKEELFRKGLNYGVRLRACDLVVDIDPRNGGDESMLGFDTSKFPTVLTPSGGKHLYMKKPSDFKIHHTVKCFPGIEFKTEGRQVVGPGSTHPNGKRYEFDEIFAPPFGPEGAPDLPEVLAIRIKMEDFIPTGNGIWTEQQLEVVLSHLDPVNYAAHDTWLSIMMASHEATGGTGEDVFTQWSLRDPQYQSQEKIIRGRWQSLRSGKAGNAGPGTLRHLLVEAGVKDIGFDNAADEFGKFVEENPASSEPETPPTKSALQDMNERFYVVQEDGKLRILEIRKDDSTGETHWIRYSKHDFQEVAQSVYLYPLTEEKRGDKIVAVPLAKKWIESNTVNGKRVFPGGTVFAPEIDSERVGESLNLWRGFQFKPDFQGSWDLLADLTLNILCRGDNESFQYVLNWMARAVQFPHIPAGTAIVFKGIKGIGKGTLGRTFIKLFGIHGMHVSSMEHITGRFNIHLMDCVAMFADEAYWAGNRSAEGAFKALITEPWKLYEAKGLTPRRGRNCIHIIMASNEDWVIPAGLDGERRYAVFETTEESRPPAFWKALNAQLDNGGYGALLFDLLYRDITDFQVHAVPKTEALAAQKLQTMDPGEQWIYSLLHSGNWNGLPTYESGAILAADLQLDFTRSLGHNRNYESVEERVGRTLRKFIPGLRRIRIQRPENRIDISAIRPRAYVLPSVEVARNKFKEVLGHDEFDE